MACLHGGERPQAGEVAPLRGDWSKKAADKN